MRRDLQERRAEARSVAIEEAAGQAACGPLTRLPESTFLLVKVLTGEEAISRCVVSTMSASQACDLRKSGQADSSGPLGVHS